MQFAIYGFMFTVGLAALTFICLPDSKHRLVATTIFLAMAICAFVVGVETLGKPKPVSLEWRSFEGAEVAGMIWDERNHLVYVWASTNGVPVSYAFPWPGSQQEVDAMQDQFRQAGATGDKLLLTGSLGGEDGEIAEVIQEAPLPPK